jgi:hypothetical protein
LFLGIAIALATALSTASALSSGNLRIFAISAAAIAWMSVVATSIARLLQPPPPQRRSAAQIVVDEQGLTLIRRNGVHDRLIAFQGRYGITVFTSDSQDRAALALTTPERTLCVGAALEPNEASLDLPMLKHAVTLSSTDLIQATITPDGEALVVNGASLRRLFLVLTQMDQHALDRCFLSDTSGEQVVLDGTTFHAKRRTFDLSQPFEWRSSVFREHAGDLNATFQATWVKQKQDEVVLVALLGSEARWSLDGLADNAMNIQVARDCPFLEDTLEPPPPKDRRVGIDRLFMQPLRSAMSRARQNHPNPRRDSAEHQ